MVVCRCWALISAFAESLDPYRFSPIKKKWAVAERQFEATHRVLFLPQTGPVAALRAGDDDEISSQNRDTFFHSQTLKVWASLSV
jgi:hypothetical protein